MRNEARAWRRAIPTGRLLALFALGALAACQPLTRPPPPAGSWAERKAQLQSASRWRFDGRVAVSGVESGGSAGIRWQQADARSRVSVFGTLGAGGINIVLDAGHLHVKTSRGEEVDGEEAARVIDDRLGVPLPLAELRYWLLGVTAPGSESTEVLGENQRLAALTQKGWEVHFAEYQRVAGDLLPARVDARRDQVRVKLRISRWQWQ